MTSMLAIGVLCDDPEIFNEALAYFTDGVVDAVRGELTGIAGLRVIARTRTV